MWTALPAQGCSQAGRTLAWLPRLSERRAWLEKDDSDDIAEDDMMSGAFLSATRHERRSVERRDEQRIPVAAPRAGIISLNVFQKQISTSVDTLERLSLARGRALCHVKGLCIAAHARCSHGEMAERTAGLEPDEPRFGRGHRRLPSQGSPVWRA
ncbi:hypothetical protein VTN00DRAFT_2559 [Thermoascus crustaceus]|uniref:uncharacterized protein n=1 Tax=Thermoascus crustaceus TaxID=5088 RepID=UPI003743D558